jgi:hypothetical protein
LHAARDTNGVIDAHVYSSPGVAATSVGEGYTAEEYLKGGKTARTATAGAETKHNRCFNYDSPLGLIDWRFIGRDQARRPPRSQKETETDGSQSVRPRHLVGDRPIGDENGKFFTQLYRKFDSRIGLT